MMWAEISNTEREKMETDLVSKTTGLSSPEMLEFD